MCIRMFHPAAPNNFICQMANSNRCRMSTTCCYREFQLIDCMAKAAASRSAWQSKWLLNKLSVLRKFQAIFFEEWWGESTSLFSYSLYVSLSLSLKCQRLLCVPCTVRHLTYAKSVQTSIVFFPSICFVFVLTQWINTCLPSPPSDPPKFKSMRNLLLKQMPIPHSCSCGLFVGLQKVLSIPDLPISPGCLWPVCLGNQLLIISVVSVNCCVCCVVCVVLCVII